MFDRFNFAESPDALARQIERYLDAHPDETRQLLGLSVGTTLGVKVLDMEMPIRLSHDVTTATLSIGRRDAQRVMAYTRSCNWANGIVLVPTLTRLVFAGAFRGLTAGMPRSMRSMVLVRQPHPTRNLGVMWGALNLLSLAGWLTLSSADEHAEFSLTPAGEYVVKCVEHARPLFLLLANSTSTLQHLHALCHQVRVDPAESVLYAQVARICIAGWELPVPTNDVERHAGEQLRMAMDGLLLGPTWAALDMPGVRQARGRALSPDRAEHTRQAQQSGRRRRDRRVARYGSRAAACRVVAHAQGWHGGHSSGEGAADRRGQDSSADRRAVCRVAGFLFAILCRARRDPLRQSRSARY